jgi:hypothetical protein
MWYLACMELSRAWTCDVISGCFPHQDAALHESSGALLAELIQRALVSLPAACNALMFALPDQHGLIRWAPALLAACPSELALHQAQLPPALLFRAVMSLILVRCAHHVRP